MIEALRKAADAMSRFAKQAFPERCEYCDEKVEMMYMKGSGFCSLRCQEYEYYEEVQDAETESP